MEEMIAMSDSVGSSSDGLTALLCSTVTDMDLEEGGDVVDLL